VVHHISQIRTASPRASAGELIFTQITSVPVFTGADDVIPPRLGSHNQVLGHGQRVFKSSPGTKPSIPCTIAIFFVFHSFSTKKIGRRYVTERDVCHREESNYLTAISGENR
jgi:hypothetical protein